MNFAIEILVCVLKSIAILYLWAVICFLFYRYSRPETPERLRGFLKERYEFYAIGFTPIDSAPVTARDLKVAGMRGWCFLGASFFGLGAEAGDLRFLLSVATLFFGGLMIAWSWYGLRSLRMLGLQSHSTRC